MANELGYPPRDCVDAAGLRSYYDGAGLLSLILQRELAAVGKRVLRVWSQPHLACYQECDKYVESALLLLAIVSE
jgi:hypothetical protein